MRIAILALALLAPLSLRGQLPDTARTSALPTVVVTAERARTTIESSVSSVTRISAAELARMPRATLADVLRLAPGFAIVDLDGLGFDPQLMVRGLYGRGEFHSNPNERPAARSARETLSGRSMAAASRAASTYGRSDEKSYRPGEGSTRCQRIVSRTVAMRTSARRP